MRLSYLRLHVATETGSFGAEVPLNEGINFISAGNNSGKSTILNSILYTLGLEEILGKQGPESLKPALRDELKYSGSKFSILESVAELELLNREGEALTIRRSIVGEDNHRLVRVTRGPRLTSPSSTKDIAPEPYYLHDPGAAQSKKGFHKILSEFLELELPRVPTYRGNDVPLYLQCVFPLLFIEQQRGWSQIQATTPTKFGIRNVKQKSIEYILELDISKIQNQKQQINIEKERIKNKWDSIKSDLESLAERVGGVLKKMPPKPRISISIEDAPTIFYPVEDTLVSIGEHLVSLREEFEKVRNDAKTAYSDYKDEEKEYAKKLEQAEEDLLVLESRMKSMRREVNQEKDNIEMLNQRISSLSDDIKKNRDAKKLREFGAELGMSTANNECPTCHQSIDRVLLDQNEDRTPMSIDRNIEFLKMQRRAAERLKEESEESMEEKKKIASSISKRISNKRQEIKDLKTNITDEGKYPDISEIRRAVKLDENINKIEDAKEEMEEAYDKISSLSEKWEDILARQDDLPDDMFSSEDKEKLGNLSGVFRDNVDRFGYTSSGSEEIDVSRDMYMPTIEGFEVLYDASASDNIRMIWAYTLALQQVSEEYDGNHPNVSFFDEPGQQNIDSESRMEFYAKMDEMSSGRAQFLIATSENTDLLESCVDSENRNIVEFEDRVINPL